VYGCSPFGDTDDARWPFLIGEPARVQHNKHNRRGAVKACADRARAGAVVFGFLDAAQEDDVKSVCCGHRQSRRNGSGEPYLQRRFREETIMTGQISDCG